MWLLWPVRGFTLFVSWPRATLTAGSTSENSGRLDERWMVRYCGWWYSEMRFNSKQNKSVLNSIFFCAVWSYKLFYLPHILKDLSENRSSSAVYHLSLPPGAGLGVLGSIWSLCSTDVQPNGWWRKVESRADTWTGGQWGSVVPWPPPCTEIPLKGKKVSKCKFPESSLTWSSTFRWFTTCLWVMSLSISPQSVDI